MRKPHTKHKYGDNAKWFDRRRALRYKKAMSYRYPFCMLNIITLFSPKGKEEAA